MNLSSKLALLTGFVGSALMMTGCGDTARRKPEAHIVKTADTTNVPDFEPDRVGKKNTVIGVDNIALDSTKGALHIEGTVLVTDENKIKIFQKDQQIAIDLQLKDEHGEAVIYSSRNVELDYKGLNKGEGSFAIVSTHDGVESRVTIVADHKAMPKGLNEMLENMRADGEEGYIKPARTSGFEMKNKVK